MTSTGQRSTRQKQRVIDSLNASDVFRSAQEIHEDIRGSGDTVGLSTVYRTLQSLAHNEEIDCLIRTDGEALYRKCSQTHHHHLVCRQCGRTIEVKGPAVEKWADSIAKEHSFSEVSHTLEIFGRCSSCPSLNSH